MSYSRLSRPASGAVSGTDLQLEGLVVLRVGRGRHDRGAVDEAGAAHAAAGAAHRAHAAHAPDATHSAHTADAAHATRVLQNIIYFTNLFFFLILPPMITDCCAVINYNAFDKRIHDPLREAAYFVLFIYIVTENI